jgi:hypothetical protein
LTVPPGDTDLVTTRVEMSLVIVLDVHVDAQPGPVHDAWSVTTPAASEASA